MEPTLSQALHLLNGDTVNAKIQQGGLDRQADGRRRSSPRSGSSSSTSAASRRKPTAEELEKLLPVARRRGRTRQQALEDIFWALLNSREFLFNH